MLDEYCLNGLVVDDMAAMRSMMKSQLLSLGVARVAEVPNAALAIDKLRGDKFDLLLVDYYLGDATDGQQLLELVRNEQLVASSAVIVMVTAEKAYGQVAKVAEHAPDAYVIKPFTAETLLRHLRPVIERKMGIRQLHKKTPGLKPIYDQFDAGRYDAVIALVDAYTQREGVRADTARLKADALMKKGDYVRALEHYLELHETYAWAALGVARVRLQLRQTDAAIAELERLVAESPQYVHAADVLAEAYVQANHTDRALAALEAACARSPTVNRMRAAAQVAEQAGDDARLVQWAGKVVDANKFAMVQDYTDHARLVRGLVNAGQLDKAVSSLARFENEIPQVRQSASVQAAKARTLAAQIDHETHALQDMPASIRDRRMAHVKERQARLDELVGGLEHLEHRPEEAAFLSEAYMATGREEQAARSAAHALAHGCPLPPGMGSEAWRQQVATQTAEKTRARIKEGLDLLRAGQTREALSLFMHLVEHTPADLTPQLLANVVSTVVILRQKGEASASEFMPFARTALERLKHEYPDYERLPGLLQAFAHQEPPPRP